MGLYELFIIMQIISIVLLATFTVYLFVRWHGQSQSYLFVYCIATLVNNLGYLMEMLAKTKEAALAGTKMAYLGKSFIPLSLFFLVLHLCGVELPEVVKVILLMVHVSIVGLVFSCEYHPLFYTSIGYTQEGVFPHLVLGHGIFYYIFMGSVFAYYFIDMVIAWGQIRREKYQFRKTLVVYLSICGTISVAGLLVYMLGISKGYDTTSVAFFICIVSLYICMRRFDLLDTASLVKDYLVDNLSEGIIAIDVDEKVIYTNDAAMKIYPKIYVNEQKVLNTVERLIKDKENLVVGRKVFRPEKLELFQAKMHCGYIYILNDITDSYRFAMEMQDAAIRDGMTGLFNRNEITRQINQAIEKCRTVHLIMLDIDDFKQVNDTYGHDVGDLVIIGLANILKKVVGDFEGLSVGRWGGEEFILLVRDWPTGEVQEIAESARCMFSNMEFEKVGRKTISVGIVMHREGESVREIYKRVDEALYQAKTAGKNRTILL